MARVSSVRVFPGPRADDGGAADPATATEHQPSEPAGLVFDDRPVHLVAAAGARGVARSVDGRADGGDLGLVKVTRGDEQVRGAG